MNINEIAKLAGVSRATVSRYLNDGYVSEEKREKIKVQVVKFYQKKYPNEDTSWLESLTEKQYDEIFDKLLNDENLDKIKHRIDEMKKVVSFFMKI